MIIDSIYELSWIEFLGTGQKDGFFFDLNELQRITKPRVRIGSTGSSYTTIAYFEITFKNGSVVGVNTHDERQHSRFVDAQELRGSPELESRLHLQLVHAELIEAWKLHKRNT